MSKHKKPHPWKLKDCTPKTTETRALIEFKVASYPTAPIDKTMFKKGKNADVVPAFKK